MFLKSLIVFWTIISFQMLLVFGLAGFYGDNGIDQTVRKKNILRSDVELIRNHILEMVGLPYRPKKLHKIHHIRRKKNPVPKFLRKVYDRLSKDEDEHLLDSQLTSNFKTEQNDGITDDHARIIEMSDTVMTFLNNHNSFSNSVNESRLSFDLSKISIDGINGDLLMSELHVFKRGIDGEQFASNPCRIIIYAARIVNGFKEAQPIQTIEKTFGFEGWIQINFTTTFSEWLAEGKSNNLLNFEIEYNDIDHLITSHAKVNSLLSFNDDDDQQPFIIAYFGGDEAEGHVLKHSSVKNLPGANEYRRSKRSTRSLKPSKQHSSKLTLANHLINPSGSVQSKRCQRHTLYITFSQLRWDDWIFAPSGYGAFYCAGSCDYPLGNQVEATNHAVIQQLVHLLQSHDIPKPCCAPSKLQTISLMYENHGAIFLKKYRGMVAEKCSCL